jgi:hypothetical protein
MAALNLDRLPITVGRYWLGEGNNQVGGGIKAASFCETTLNVRTLLDVYGPLAIVPLFKYENAGRAGSWTTGE